MNQLRVVEGHRVDLISPFPAGELPRLYNWLYCYRSFIDTDLSPKGEEECIAYYRQSLDVMPTYGVIDKHNYLGIAHEAPLVGFVSAEPSSPWNSFMHVASTRKAWGSGLMDEALLVAIQDQFDHSPELLRVSTIVAKTNHPAQSLAKRIGAQYEGTLHHFIRQAGRPVDCVCFGLTRQALADLSAPQETL